MNKTLFIAHYDKDNPYAVEYKLILSENGENTISVVMVNVPNKYFIVAGLKQLEERLSDPQPVDGDQSLVSLRYLLSILKGKGNRMQVSKPLIKTVANLLHFKWLKPEHVIYVMG